jgi:flavin reductase (DIM6/NTAB) family NADH-FMN oxidoreductase RutF
MCVERDTFLSIMGSFPSGVTIVTTMDDHGRPVGLTSTAMCSVSAQPPLLLVSVAKSSRTLPWLLTARSFAVNILGAEAATVSQRFASRADDKFDDVDWRLGDNGLPILHRASIAWAECDLEHEVDTGDHVLLLGRVLCGESRSQAEPLVYFRRGYGRWSGRVLQYPGEVQPSLVPDDRAQPCRHRGPAAADA